jgi:hypothetical protein
VTGGDHAPRHRAVEAVGCIVGEVDDADRSTVAEGDAAKSVVVIDGDDRADLRVRRARKADGKAPSDARS